MGQVKKAVMEVEDFVSNCIVKNRTLNQTILRCKRSRKKQKSNPYLDDEDLIENKYYKLKGAE